MWDIPSGPHIIVLRTFNLGCVSTGLSTEMYFKPCQSSKMELFPKIFDGFQPLTIFVKSSVLDAGQFWIRLCSMICIGIMAISLSIKQITKLNKMNFSKKILKWKRQVKKKRYINFRPTGRGEEETVYSWIQ